ncbi:MAG: TonB-dependent receptor [Planctomycetota bacterium]
MGWGAWFIASWLWFQESPVPHVQVVPKPPEPPPIEEPLEQGEPAATKGEVPPREVVSPAELAPATGAAQNIYVTATRNRNRAFDLPYTVESAPGVGADHLHSPRTATDIVGSSNAVVAQKTAPGQGSPTLRGFTGFRVLTLVDGIRLNNSVYRDGANQYTQLVDPLMLDRAEILFGPASVLYGSDAIGGTINFLSRDPAYSTDGVRTGGRVYQRYGSADQSSVSRSEVELSTHNFAFQLGGSWRDYGDLSGGRHQGLFENTGYNEYSTDGKAILGVADNLELVGGYQRHIQDEVPRTHSTTQAVSYRGTAIGTDLARDTTLLRDLVYVKARNRRADEDVRGEWTVYRYLLNEREDRVLTNSRLRIQGFNDSMIGTVFHLSMPTLGDGRTTFGGEYSFEEVDSNFREHNPDGSLRMLQTRGAVADQSNYQMAGVFVEHALPVSSSFDLIGGLRYTLVDVDADEVDPILADGTFFSSVHETFSALVGSVRAVCHVREDLNVYAGASQGFRAPNLSDLTRSDVSRSGEVEIPATDLDPEHYLTFEVGTKLDHEFVTCQLATYYTLIDDMIIRFPTGTTDGSGNPIVTKDNVGDGYVSGVELSAVVPLPRDFAAFGAFAWMEGRVEDFKTLTVKDDEPITRVNPTSGLFGLRYAPRDLRYSLEAEVRVVNKEDRLSQSDRRDTQRIPPDGTPAYSTIALRGTYEPIDRLYIFAIVENLTDRDYRVHGSGTNDPGTSVMIGIDWRF